MSAPMVTGPDGNDRPARLGLTARAFLDTSGVVATPNLIGGVNNSGLRDWRDLDPFTQGYILGMFEGLSVAPQSRPDGLWDWALTDLNEADWWCDDKPADAPAFKAPRFDSLAPETLTRIIADCVEYVRRQPNHRESTLAGRGFWLDRQDDESSFPPLTVELDDDGKVHLS